MQAVGRNGVKPLGRGILNVESDADDAHSGAGGTMAGFRNTRVPVRVRNQFDLRVEFSAMRRLNRFYTAGADIVFPYITGTGTVHEIQVIK